MAYQPGEYTRYLKAAHQNGEHVEDPADNCPACNYRAVPSGFNSLDEYHGHLMEVALDLQGYVDAHYRGEHKKKSDSNCIECAQDFKEENG